jgi:hypothetical protein
MDYGQINAASALSGNRVPGLIVDKTCKLLKSAQPLVWAVSIVFGLLGVTLILRYLWVKKPAPAEAQGGGVTWMVS